MVLINAFSRKNVTLILKNIVCRIDDKDVLLDKNAVASWAKEHTTSKFPDFKYESNSTDHNLMNSNVAGNVFFVDSPENKKRIDVSISVEIIFDENDSVEGTVHATFLNKKRKCVVTILGLPVV